MNQHLKDKVKAIQVLEEIQENMFMAYDSGRLFKQYTNRVKE